MPLMLTPTFVLKADNPLLRKYTTLQINRYLVNTTALVCIPPSEYRTDFGNIKEHGRRPFHKASNPCTFRIHRW